MHALTGGSAGIEVASSYISVGESTSTEELGLALHRLGDSFAHSTIADGTRMYDAPLGHVFDMTFGTDPDKIANRPELYENYVSLLSSALGNRLNFKGQVDLFTFDYVAEKKEVQNKIVQYWKQRLESGREQGFLASLAIKLTPLMNILVLAMIILGEMCKPMLFILMLMCIIRTEMENGSKPVQKNGLL
jgi:hypothetical protein